jgi:CheY-like chemotaxis protein
MSGLRVMVADRDRDVADTLCAFLATAGFTCRVFYDGWEAIQYAADWHPHGALLDLSLPHASGMDVAKRLRKAFGRRIRLIAFTGWTDPALHREALDAGFDEVVLKPSNPTEILQSLNAAGMALVLEAEEVIVRRLGLLLDLAECLVKRRFLGIADDAAALARIIEFVYLDLRNATIDEADRVVLERRLKGLCERAPSACPPIGRANQPPA